jgi:hypothetical protein
MSTVFTSDVKWRASFVVYRLHIQALLHEVLRQRCMEVRLPEMKHIPAEEIHCIHVSTMREQPL